ncbi:MAG: HAD hydrolase family protein [Deltaproteobacteria bacterium]|jgi:3-deoxy-D-manno-octulosonate 8-phosphate phosphatase (KDO 8-P phosphatase)|nr:HAD hydrolase family protein [Deltaproteobacteria bacterium]
MKNSRYDTVKDPMFKDIKWFGFDVDGVMTDGGIILQDDMVEAKRFHSRDGHAIKLLGRSGMKVAIITGRQSKVVEHRAKELRITELYQNYPDKLQIYLDILQKEGLTPAETAFMGDDIVDLPILIRCGLPICPSDAVPEVKRECLYVTPSRGGHGAVREAVEYFLKARGLWEAVLERYLS